MVNKALSLRGTPYVWSAYAQPCSAKGANCECINRLSYKAIGRSLTYTLYGQIRAGKVVRVSQPSDLVFFDVNRDGDFGDAHDHTGVMVGNGYMVHGSSYFGKAVKQTVSSFQNYENVRTIKVQIL